MVLTGGDAEIWKIMTTGWSTAHSDRHEEDGYTVTSQEHGEEGILSNTAKLYT